MPRLTRILLASIFVAGCGMSESTGPAVEGSETVLAAGDVHYSCTVESSTGSLINCTFSCVEEDEIFFWDSNGDGVCGSPGGPEPDGPDDPPGGGGSNPPPEEVEVVVTLSCSDNVVRTSPGGCSVSAEPSEAQLSGMYWTFLHLDGNVAKSGGEEWTGKLVATGEIRLQLSVGGQAPILLRDTINVIPRTGGSWASWNSTAWDLDEQNAWVANWVEDQYTLDAGDPMGIGRWCMSEDCHPAIGFVRPSYVGGESGGYVLTRPDDGGPNGPIWYVASTSFYSEAVNAIHPKLLPSSAHEYSGMSSCSARNWYNANRCLNVPASVLDALIAGAQNHEGDGSTGSNGHQSQAENVADDYDLLGAVEGQTSLTQSWVEAAVEYEVVNISNQIHTRISGLPEPSGNFTPKDVFLRDIFSWVAYQMKEPGS